MNRLGGDGEFDRWLEQELQATVASAQGPSPRAAQATYRTASRTGGRLLAIKSRFLAAVGTKGAVGLAAAALAIGGGSVAAMAATGSANPTNWGQQVVKQVEACKAKAQAAGTHGIGECVSAFAKQHGEAQQDKHGNSNDNDDRTSTTSTGKPASPGSQGSSHGQSGSHSQSSGAGESGQSHGQAGQTHGSEPSPSPHGH